MWNTVVKAYKSDKRVYFEPMNEPHGYTDTEWADLAAKWLDTYPRCRATGSSSAAPATTTTSPPSAPTRA
jgi:hypothetical protein